MHHIEDLRTGGNYLYGIPLTIAEFSGCFKSYVLCFYYWCSFFLWCKWADIVIVLLYSMCHVFMNGISSFLKMQLYVCMKMNYIKYKLLKLAKLFLWNDLSVCMSEWQGLGVLMNVFFGFYTAIQRNIHLIIACHVQCSCSDIFRDNFSMSKNYGRTSQIALNFLWDKFMGVSLMCTLVIFLKI